MKVAMLHGERDLRVNTQPDPELPSPHWMLARTMAASFCGSDLARYMGAQAYSSRGLDFTADNKPVEYPYCFQSHEAAFEVVEVGTAVTRWKVGDRLATALVLAGGCGRCPSCVRGVPHTCTGMRLMPQWKVDFSPWLGAGELTAFDCGPDSADWLTPIPDELPNKAGALVEPASCAVHAVERADIKPHHTVVVWGVGGLGALILSVAALHRPRRLIAIDISAYRLEKAKRLGADTIINATEVDLNAVMADLTGGAGPDIIIEVTGVPEVVLQAIELAGFGTRLVVAGVFHRPADGFNPLPIHFKEIDILGSRGPYAHYTADGELVAVNLLRRGLIDVDTLLDTYAFEAINQALHDAVNGLAGPKVGVIYGG